MTIPELLAGLIGSYSNRVFFDGRSGASWFIEGGKRTLLASSVTAHRPQHTFTDLDSFAAYLSRWMSPAFAEILFDGAKVRALEDAALASPSIIECATQPHPRRARWDKLVGRPLTQDDLYRAVIAAPEDFAPVATRDGTLTGETEGHLLAGQVRVLTASRSATFTSEVDERGFKVRSGSDAKQEVSVRIPSEVRLRVPWFLGEPNVATARLFVRVDMTEQGRPVFQLDYADRDIVEHEARLALVMRLRDLLGEGWLVGLGSLHTDPVVAADRKLL